MRSLRVLYHMMRADFLERTRRYSFLITLLAVIYLGYQVNTGKLLLHLAQYRGIYNSAWVGSLMALVITTFLGYAGFYLVKNAIERDEQTGVGQIIATTPLSRVQYLLGKWLSNFALLTALCIVLACAAIVMQLLQREDPVMDLWALLAPFLLIALPMMAIVAALAILFEAIPWLRGGFGNLVYFFLFTFLMVFSITSFGKSMPQADPFGARLLVQDMARSLRQVDPAYDEENFGLGLIELGHPETFRYPGMDWTPGLAALRLSWIAAAAALAAVSAVFFNRFDSSKDNLLKLAGHRQGNRAPAEGEGAAKEHARLAKKRARPGAGLAILGRLAPRSAFLRLVQSELRLTIKGQRWFWYAGVLVIWSGCLFAPLADMRYGWLAAAAIWPVLLWSQLGVREARYATGQMVFTAPHPFLRLLPATWLSGVLAGGLVTLGAGVRWLAAGDGAALLAWLLFILLAPSMALAVGTWSRTSKLFEVLYLLWWYIGPLNRFARLDYLGVTPDAVILRQPLVIVGMIGVLCLAALVGRQRQLDH